MMRDVCKSSSASQDEDLISPASEAQKEKIDLATLLEVMFLCPSCEQTREEQL